METRCEMLQEDGERCTASATHLWGKVPCCCPHFDQIVNALFELSTSAAERRHTELLALYENYSRQIEKLTGWLPDHPEKTK